MINRITLDEQLAGMKVITFRSALGKTQGKLTVSPVISKKTGKMLGVQLLSEEEKKKHIHVVESTTERDIYDGFQLHLDDETDRIDWEWIQYCPELVASYDEIFSNPNALFYIENTERDTDNRIRERGIKIKAFSYLNDANATKKVEILRLMNIDATSMSPKDIEDILGEMADVSPRKVVEAFEDKMIKIKLFLYACLDKRIITVDQNGVYQWGAFILGVSEESALKWLQIRENASYVARLQELVYPKVTSPIEEPTHVAELASTIPAADLTNVGSAAEESIKQEYERLFGAKPHHNAKIENLIDKINQKKAELSATEI
jgi:hypothetical protein